MNQPKLIEDLRLMDLPPNWWLFDWENNDQPVNGVPGCQTNPNEVAFDSLK